MKEKVKSETKDLFQRLQAYWVKDVSSIDTH